ncbi:MAG TPA: LLM class flavin-dependent oxidoreductase [Vicinamibacterales bacterium]|jgi:alkanesulfonate monooxygenase SsuD/methylene tetrahydromethanopterin reductase-like flavin-dependent oxidoreductase (luciferase family)|nr:LLM class flavin-dependent oxidoreductase [Vicinamibacterales bacterium]
MSILDRLEFYLMHFMPYPDIVPGRPQGQWVDIPNTHFDPKKGHKLYQEYFDELALGDELGFDGLVVNEHHSTFYSLMPSCTVAAAALVARTRRARICVFGTPIGLTYPHRLAEEYAMLDVMSGGRLECAFPLGTGMEYWVNPVNPSYARERFREAMDILMQAWTQPGPTRYDGRFYQYKVLNPFPLPYQKPHPRIYVVGTGTEDTIQFAAEKGFGYSQVFTPIAQQLKSFANYREAMTRHGHQLDSGSVIISAMPYVAETEEQAMSEGREHILFYFKNLLRTTAAVNSPPGYMPVDRLRKRLEMTNGQEPEITWEALNTVYRTVLGTPDHVAERIAFWCEEAQSSKIVLHLHIGDMPHWKAVKNITLFAQEVIPRLRRTRSPSLGVAS